MALAAAIHVELRPGARLADVLAAFELLHRALAAHGHVWTLDEQAVLDDGARVLERNLDADSR